MHFLDSGLFLIGLVLVEESCGFCVRDKVNETAISTFGIYCMYKEHVLTIGQTEKFPLPDCVECTCEESGLKCCGYGSTAAVSASVPPGPESKCEQIKDGCYIKWVYKDNQSKDCAKEDIPLIPTPSASH